MITTSVSSNSVLAQSDAPRVQQPTRWSFAARRPRVVIVLVAVGVLVGTLIGWRVTRGAQVEGVVAVRRELVQKVVATGRVMAPAKVNLGVALIGTVAKVFVEEGDAVKAGQVLVQVDATEAKALVAQAQADLGQAQARLGLVHKVTRRISTQGVTEKRASFEQSQRQYQRMQALLESGAETPDNVEQARRNLDIARSQLEAAEIQAESSQQGGSEFQATSSAVLRARAALEAARARLGQTTIIAPTDGLILTRSVEPGDVVQPGRVLLVMARSGPILLTVQADEKNLAYLRLGQSALSSADAFPSEVFPAQVGYIAPAVDPLRATVELRLKVPNPPSYLLPDMTVSVDIEVQRRSQALVLPASAINEASTDHPWVFVEQGGRAERRAVRLGVKGQGGLEVLHGIQDGDTVLVASGAAVKTGARVRVTRVSREVSGAI